MSRSALTRQGAPPPPPPPVADAGGDAHQVKQDELPIHGNDTTYNLNNLLYHNIMQSTYFRDLYKLTTYHEVVDEIYYRVEHAEPLSPGTSRIASTCFCLLMKFFTMRLTRKQMQGLLRHPDSPYIRAIGFLYLRYTCDPKDLWSWYAPYLDDPEEFNASANPNNLTTIGAWLRGLLAENQYYGTILPRIPKKIQDDINVKLLLHSRKKEREEANLKIVEYLQVGTKIRAMYSDEENEPAMYDAVIDSIEPKNHFWVTFPEYGNTEKVALGDIEFTPPRKRSPRRSRSSSRQRHRSRSTSRPRRRSRSSSRHRRRSRSRSRRRRSRSPRRSRRSRSSSRASGLTTDLLEQVREKERRKAEAVGKDYAARPASYKGSLSLKLDRYTTRERSPSPKKERKRRPRSPTPEKSEPKEQKVSKEALERMAKLKKMYGDASSKKE